MATVHYEFKALGPCIHVDTDDRLLRIRSLFFGRSIEWSSIVGAGMMAPSPVLAIPSFIFPLFAAPGYKAITGKAESMMKASTRIWIAYRPGNRVKLMYLTLPRTSESSEFVSDLRWRLIDRWNDALAGAYGLRRRFGLSNRWFWLKALLFVIVVLTLLLVGLLAWATVLAVVSDIRVALVILFVVAAWWLYKQFRTKPSV